MNEHLKNRMYYLVRISMYYLHSIIVEIHDYFFLYLVKKLGCKFFIANHNIIVLRTYALLAPFFKIFTTVVSQFTRTFEPSLSHLFDI